MKLKKNNNLKITTNIKADLSAGIIDMIGNDYDSVCQFLGVMLGMMDSGEWGFVDNEMRCENDRALKNNYRTLCFYAYYNLAKYFYMNGYDSKYNKDIDKAVEYLDIASSNNILNASLELFYFYCNEYLNSKDIRDKELILLYKERIEGHNSYNEKLRIEIENKIDEIVNKKEINIDSIV